MDWALAEHQTHNLVSAPQGTQTNPSLSCDTFSLLQKIKIGVHCFSGPPCCLRQYSKRETLEILRDTCKKFTPQYLRDIIQTMYTGCLYLLIDGDKTSGEVAPNKGLKQGCPLSPLLYSLYTNDIDRFLTVQRDAATALDSVQVPHCDYADDIALTSNTAEYLQFQLNKFHNYTRSKGLKLNTDKTKIMVFFSKDTSAIPTFTYDGTPL